jgi:hypothetical protein
MENKYADAKILGWWRDTEFEEYFAIIEVNGDWKLSVTKVEDHNAKL